MAKAAQLGRMQKQSHGDQVGERRGDAAVHFPLHLSTEDKVLLNSGVGVRERVPRKVAGAAWTAVRSGGEAATSPQAASVLFQSGVSQHILPFYSH